MVVAHPVVRTGNNTKSLCQIGLSAVRRSQNTNIQAVFNKVKCRKNLCNTIGKILPFSRINASLVDLIQPESANRTSINSNGTRFLPGPVLAMQEKRKQSWLSGLLPLVQPCAPHRAAHGLGRQAGPALPLGKGPGQVPVGNYAPKGNLPEQVPERLLKRSPGRGEGSFSGLGAAPAKYRSSRSSAARNTGRPSLGTRFAPRVPPKYFCPANHALVGPSPSLVRVMGPGGRNIGW